MVKLQEGSGSGLASKWKVGSGLAWHQNNILSLETAKENKEKRKKSCETVSLKVNGCA
jgi:hypothetical protein